MHTTARLKLKNCTVVETRHATMKKKKRTKGKKNNGRKEIPETVKESACIIITIRSFKEN